MTTERANAIRWPAVLGVAAALAAAPAFLAALLGLASLRSRVALGILAALAVVVPLAGTEAAIRRAEHEVARRDGNHALIRRGARRGQRPASTAAHVASAEGL